MRSRSGRSALICCNRVADIGLRRNSSKSIAYFTKGAMNLLYTPARAALCYPCRAAAPPPRRGGPGLGARLGPSPLPDSGAPQTAMAPADVAGAPAGPGSLQNASGCITSAHLRACTKPVGTMVGFALFGGHRGVAQGRPAGRIGPWTVATSRIRCYRTMSPPPGTQLTGCFGNEVGYARPQSGRAIGQAHNSRGALEMRSVCNPSFHCKS